MYNRKKLTWKIHVQLKRNTDIHRSQNISKAFWIKKKYKLLYSSKMRKIVFFKDGMTRIKLISLSHLISVNSSAKLKASTKMAKDRLEIAVKWYLFAFVQDRIVILRWSTANNYCFVDWCVCVCDSAGSDFLSHMSAQSLSFDINHYKRWIKRSCISLYMYEGKVVSVLNIVSLSQ